MLDVVIIGAGPAGLMASIYLARFHRKAAIIDAGESRARWIPKSHNIPGFSTGIGGAQFLARLHEQAVRYGVEIHRAKVETVSGSEGDFCVQTESSAFVARFVILGTGVRDQLPNLDGAEESLLRSTLRVCPICDAFEATGKRIAVIGSGEHACRESEFLRSYSDSVTLIDVGDLPQASARSRLESSGVRVIKSTLKNLRLESNGLVVSQPEGMSDFFDVAYSALGCKPGTDVAVNLGAQTDESGALRVNTHQETSVGGLYAAGDVVRGLNQVVVAAAEAAIAATDIHNRLRLGRTG